MADTLAPDGVDDPATDYLIQYADDPAAEYLKRYDSKPPAKKKKPVPAPVAPAPVLRPDYTGGLEDAISRVSGGQRRYNIAPDYPVAPDVTAVRSPGTAPTPSLPGQAMGAVAAVAKNRLAQLQEPVGNPLDPEALKETGLNIAMSIGLGAPEAVGAGTAAKVATEDLSQALDRVGDRGGVGAASSRFLDPARSSRTAPDLTPILDPTRLQPAMLEHDAILNRPPIPESEQLHAGLPPIPKEAIDAVKTATSQAFTNPYAPIAEAHPEVSDALQTAGAMVRPKAETFVRQMGQRVLKGLTPKQQEQFGIRLTLDNLDAEAERKALGASSTADRAVAHRTEVRSLAKQALAEEQAKADQVWEGAQQKGEALMQDAPPEAPSNVDEHPAIRASRQKAVAEHAAKVQSVFDDAALTQNEIMKAAQQDHDLAVKMGDQRHEELQADAYGKSEAATRAKAEADKLRKRVPVGIELQPWFKQALARHKEMVQPFNEQAALKAGVDQGSFRDPKLGAYIRLTPQDALNEELIGRTQETAARSGTGAVTPRTGKMRTVFGQKPSVTALLPAGGEAPLQGPINIAREASTVASPTAATSASGSAKEFRGLEPGHVDPTGARVDAGGYSTDYLTNITRDAGDKVTKAGKNGVYQAIVNDAMKENATVRKLLPDENPATGERLLAFNDQKDIIQPPLKTDPNYQTVQRFAVPQDVADALKRYQATSTPRSMLGKAWEAANRAVMKSVLQTPVLSGTVAAGHTLTEASNVSRGLPAGRGPLATIISGLPVVKSADAGIRAARVDMAAASTTERLHRLALSGALRLSDERGKGWVDAAHEALFGPNGVDTRMRLVASEDAEAAWKKAGGDATDPAFTGYERDYVNGASGNYTQRNQGTAIQALTKSGITPFIAIGRAKLGGALKATVGGGGPPGASIGDRILRAQRGPLGQTAIISGAGYLLSGHGPQDNAPGHETDMATGVYALPDGSHHYFRGDPDEAAKQFGPQAKEVYLRKGFLDPGSAAAVRLLEPIAYAKSGDKVSETLRTAANTALAFVGPTAQEGTQLATGRSLYFDRDGALGSVQGVHLTKDEDLTDRLLSAARNVNAGVAIGMAPPTPGARSATSALLGNLNPFTSAKAGSAPKLGVERRQVNAWISDVTKQIYAERDDTRRKALVEEALKVAAEDGYTGPSLRATFQKAANRAGRPPSGKSEQRFENRVRGGGSTPYVPRPPRPARPAPPAPPPDAPLPPTASSTRPDPVSRVEFEYDAKGRITGAKLVRGSKPSTPVEA